MKDQGILFRYGLALACTAVLVLDGCASKSPAPVVERGGQGGAQQTPGAAPLASKDVYLVKRGDTLYSIALDHGLDYKDLVAWNAIENPNRILVGQPLRVRAPGAAAAAEGTVVKPVAMTSGVEQRSLTAGAGGEVLKREPKAGKEPYSEQALARAQAQPKFVEPVAVAVVPTAKPEVRNETRTEVRTEAKPEPRAEAKPAEAAAETRVGDAALGSEEITWTWPANGKLIGTFSEGGNKGIDINGKAGDAVLAASGGKVVYSGTGLRGYGKLVIVKHNNTFLTAYAHNQNVLVKEGQSVSKGQKIAEMGNTDADQVKLHFEVRRQGKPVDPLKHLPQR
jgi:lipoprotein NlpD